MTTTPTPAPSRSMRPRELEITRRSIARSWAILYDADPAEALKLLNFLAQLAKDTDAANTATANTPTPPGGNDAPG
jgi:hypothetical protein